MGIVINKHWNFGLKSRCHSPRHQKGIFSVCVHVRKLWKALTTCSSQCWWLLLLVHYHFSRWFGRQCPECYGHHHRDNPTPESFVVNFVMLKLRHGLIRCGHTNMPKQDCGLHHKVTSCICLMIASTFPDAKPSIGTVFAKHVVTEVFWTVSGQNDLKHCHVD